MVTELHNRFLEKYAQPGRHFSFDEAPTAYMVAGGEATPEMIERTLAVGDFEAKKQALRSPNSTREHVDVALRDPDWYVRMNALRHPTIVEGDLIKARHDASAHVREEAIRQLKKSGSEYGL